MFVVNAKDLYDLGEHNYPFGAWFWDRRKAHKLVEGQDYVVEVLGQRGFVKYRRYLLTETAANRILARINKPGRAVLA